MSGAATAPISEEGPELRPNGVGILISALAWLCFVGYGATFSSIGLFFDPIRNAFGWSSAGVALLASAFLAAMSVSSVLAGTLIDHFGAKRVVLLGIMLAGGGFICAGLCSSKITLELSFAISGIGAGASTYVPSMYLATTYVKDRVGLAVGVVMAAASAGSSVYPLLVALTLKEIGWRDTLIMTGLSVIAVTFPIPFLIFPGRDKVKARDANAPGNRRPRPTFREIRPFVMLCLMQALFFTGFMGIYFHIIPYLAGQGFSPEAASLLYGAVNIICAGGMLAIGWLSDRLSAGRVLCAGLLINAASMFIPDYVDNASGLEGALLAFVLIWGLSQGAAPQLSPILIARVVRPNHFGFYCGIAGLVQGVATAIGPYLMGYIRDVTGSYLAAFHVGAVLVLAAVLPMAATRSTLPS